MCVCVCVCVGGGGGGGGEMAFFTTFQKGVYLDSRKVFNSPASEAVKA